ncbi:MAG: HAMP domain-containing protein [Acidobacteria bacterium]|nr:HAMP domain-containing protein [Acidobacteriota bacterium]
MTDNKTASSRLSSLRGRLLFLICLATLPALLFTFVVAENERAAVLARTERDALHFARLTSREHAHQLQGARKLLSWLGSKLTRDGTRSPIIKDPEFLRALLAGHPQLANIGVLSPDGQVVASAYALPTYRSWRDNPAFMAALQSSDVVTGTYLISPIFDRPTLNHAYAVRDAAGKVIAVLFNGLDLEWLSELTRQTELPEAFSLLIVDQEGRVLAYKGAEHAEITGTAEMRIPGVADLARSQHGRMLTVSGANARRYFMAVPLEQTPGVYVAIGLPYERVLREANSTFYRTLAGLGALTLFTIAAVFIAAEIGLLRALRSLARTVQRFGAGDFGARATVARGHNELGTLAGAFNTMADSLARRHREAVEAQAQLSSLARRLHVAREAEAARISRELHDEIGQLLTSLKIDLSRLTSHCSTGEQVRKCTTLLSTAVEAMNQQIGSALNFVRRISSELRPGVLDRLGLAAALESQARDIEAHTDLAVQVEAEEIGPTLDETIAVTLFRIAQEALTNVVRHAHARVVEIHLKRTAEGIVLDIRDDGQGIRRDAVESSESLGIIGMRERATLVNGRLSVSGLPGQGTTVSVTVPVPAVTEAANAHIGG